MNPDGGKRLSGSPESLGKELLSLPDKLFFPTIPPFGALERDSKACGDSHQGLGTVEALSVALCASVVV